MTDDELAEYLYLIEKAVCNAICNALNRQDARIDSTIEYDAEATDYILQQLKKEPKIDWLQQLKEEKG